jgi:hypothetical protein
MAEFSKRSEVTVETMVRSSSFVVVEKSVCFLCIHVWSRVCSSMECSLNVHILMCVLFLTTPFASSCFIYLFNDDGIGQGP